MCDFFFERIWKLTAYCFALISCLLLQRQLLRAADSAKEAVRRVQNGARAGSGMGDEELAAATSEASKKLGNLIEHLRAKQAAGNTPPAMKAKLGAQIDALMADNRALVGDINQYFGKAKRRCSCGQS